MWKFIVDVVHDFVSSLQPDVGRGFLHVSNVFLFNTMMAERFETLPYRRLGPALIIYSILFLLMTWHHKEQGHQQPWY